MACLVGVDFCAKLMASLAKYFEVCFIKMKNSIEFLMVPFVIVTLIAYLIYAM